MGMDTSVVVDDLSFPESPRWREGRLYVSDMGTGQVLAVVGSVITVKLITTKIKNKKICLLRTISGSEPSIFSSLTPGLLRTNRTTGVSRSTHTYRQAAWAAHPS